MSDDHWMLYERQCYENGKSNFTEAISEHSWKKLKEARLSDLECLKEDFLECFLLLENERAAGWIGLRLIGRDAEFDFDLLYDKAPDQIMESVFKIVLKYITKRDKQEIYCTSKDTAINDNLVNSGAEVLDCKIYSRLYKSDVDERELMKITESVSGKINYRLVMYETIPEEILDRYLKIYNDARTDMNKFNPDKKIIEPRSKQELLRKLKWDKGPEDKMYMFMLMDNENIAAFSSLYIRNENRHIIDHAGGLTTVGRNYRGQSLAKFLKAKLYLKLLKENPEFEFIRTDTYPWNKHMYRINEEMGFKPYEKYTEMKIQRSQIEKLLSYHGRNL